LEGVGFVRGWRWWWIRNATTLRGGCQSYRDCTEREPNAKADAQSKDKH
jgi:hypothetical protein